LSEERSITPYSILLTKGTTTEGTKEVGQILNKDCSDMRPKPTTLIKTLIQLADKGKNITVLDFFAGTGTTGHALLKYALDIKEKEAKFILCTNDDEGICTDYCYPRTYKVMKTGYKNKDGQKIKPLAGNLKYFKTAFVKNSISRDDLKMRITRECTEMLCLREGIFDEVKAKPDYHIFEQNGRIMSVYYSMERDSLAQLKKELDKMEGEKILYCFTFDPLGLDKNDFAYWQGVSLEPIPQKILDIYEQIYEY
jgi:adenine-specific DNA-methyltransferase